MLADAALHLNGGSEGLGHNIFVIFIFILIGLSLWGLGRYFFPRLGMPPKGMLVWDGLFVLIAVVAIINFLATMAGHPLVAW